MSTPGRARKALFVLALIVASCAIGAVALDSPRPRGVPGPEAEAMADRMMAWVDADAWERTGAVTWDHLGGHHYLWDRERHFVEVRFGDVRVLLPLDGGRAVIEESGTEVRRTESRRLLRDKAMAYFVNDAFWLNPVARLRDEGVTRELVTHEGRRGLLVTYTRGGLTPGDSYLWLANDDGAPERWAMWVSVLPIGGIENTWEGWVTLPTGARIATRHASGPFSITMIRNLRGAARLSELVDGEDPFAGLVVGGEP